MFAFEKTTYEYNLGDRDLSSWFGYSELGLCDFNFLGSKGQGVGCGGKHLKTPF